MICNFFIIALSLGAVLSAPQFVSFKDGNVGVNFGGYHASAGLGGLLTGNAAHGGLNANAGTPFGQNAAAGLDGSVDGVTGGRAYAGAQANSQVGASSILGGQVGGSGIAGAESHSYGKSKSYVKTVSTVDQPPVVGLRSDFNSDVLVENNIQKVHPPKKYATSSSSSGRRRLKPKSRIVARRDRNKVAYVEKRKDIISTRSALPPPPPVHHQVAVRKEIVKTAPVYYEPAPSYGGYNVQKNVQFSGGSVAPWLDIPIGILQTIGRNLEGVNVSKQVSVSKQAGFF